MAKAIASNYFLRAMNEQQKWRGEECINLVPSENVTSPQVRALLASDFAHRYNYPLMAEFGGVLYENIYRGTRVTDEVGSNARRLAKEVFRAKHACVSPLSGHLAGMITIAALAQRGETMLTIAPHEDGGYDGFSEEGIPALYGLNVKYLPHDPNAWNVKSEEASEQIRRDKPALVMLGTPFMVFPYDMGPIADACKDAGSKLAYDASQVLGLVAGGQFQRPLREGADVMFGSTHKTFFGPQGGVILTDNEELDEKVRSLTTYKTVDNQHWNRIAALGQALIETKLFGEQYAKQVVRNSQILAKDLHERGFPVLYDSLGYTKCHQLMYDDREIKAIFGVDVNGFGKRLELSNIIIDIVGRIGTPEMTRLGAKERDMPALADLFMHAANGRNVKKEVRAFRRKLKLAYTVK
jgi:glycine hydroxymethyltransferase